MLIDHLMKVMWLVQVPSQLWQLQTVFTKAVTLPRLQENITPRVLLSMTTITQ